MPLARIKLCWQLRRSTLFSGQASLNVVQYELLDLPVRSQVIGKIAFAAMVESGQAHIVATREHRIGHHPAFRDSGSD
jgi:hypothetical protein